MISSRLASVAVATTLSALATVSAAQTSSVSVADALARDPQLSTLNSLVTKAGLTDTLKGAGPFTVFAPTNDAFKAVPQKTLDEVAANADLLKSVLTYHVLPAKVSAADVKTGNVKTVQGANVAVSKAGEFVTVEDAMVQKADIAATNGVIHTVDRVLMPPKR